MGYVSGDPYWLKARFASKCAGCGREVVKGARIFYWPKGKRVECETCGDVTSRRFQAEIALESW